MVTTPVKLSNWFAPKTIAAASNDWKCQASMCRSRIVSPMVMRGGARMTKIGKKIYQRKMRAKNKNKRHKGKKISKQLIFKAEPYSSDSEGTAIAKHEESVDENMDREHTLSDDMGKNESKELLHTKYGGVKDDGTDGTDAEEFDGVFCYRPRNETEAELHHECV